MDLDIFQQKFWERRRNLADSKRDMNQMFAFLNFTTIIKLSPVTHTYDSALLIVSCFSRFYLQVDI